MPTPNLNLPLIDPSMSADVPRDMNALAKAVDDAVGPRGSIALKTDVQAVRRSLDEHINDTTKHITQAERDGLRKATVDIGDVNQLATQNKTLVSAVNEVFIDVDNGLTAVANAVTDKGVYTSPNAGFAAIANNVRAIETEKIRKGTAVVSNSVYLTVTGLPFTPTAVIVKATSTQFNSSGVSVYVPKSSFDKQPLNDASLHVDASGNSSPAWQGQNSISANGFTMRVSTDTITSMEFTWIAFG